MSNFILAVGGSGSKFMQSVIHLGAAGMLPVGRREIDAQIVDPDESNGNVEETRAVATSYQMCKNQLQLGDSDLFSAHLSLQGPWTPVKDTHVDTLREIFQYDQLSRAGSADAELLELLFDPGELNMSIKQGFRGRPAIGATVLANWVNFEQGEWRALAERIGRRNNTRVNLILAGSVFGGSGAAGVPTLLRLLDRQLRPHIRDLNLGLALFLPFFQFRQVPGENIQADPNAFPAATAEALKYYDEGNFLKICRAIYAFGEAVPANAAVDAVGAATQRNEAHFIELIAGMGAMHFFSDLAFSPAEPKLGVAARKNEGTLTWEDLPYDAHAGLHFKRKLQQLALFAVAYKYIFYPIIAQNLATGKSGGHTFWVDHVERAKVPVELAGPAFRQVYEYTDHLLRWLLQISTPRREGFTPGLVDRNVFGININGVWRPRNHNEYVDSQFKSFLINPVTSTALDSSSIYKRANGIRVDNKPGVAGPGRLIRALYDACSLA